MVWCKRIKYDSPLFYFAYHENLSEYLQGSTFKCRLNCSTLVFVQRCAGWCACFSGQRQGTLLKSNELLIQWHWQSHMHPVQIYNPTKTKSTRQGFSGAKGMCWMETSYLQCLTDTLIQVNKRLGAADTSAERNFPLWVSLKCWHGTGIYFEMHVLHTRLFYWRDKRMSSLPIYYF